MLVQAVTYAPSTLSACITAIARLVLVADELPLSANARYTPVEHVPFEV